MSKKDSTLQRRRATKNILGHFGLQRGNVAGAAVEVPAVDVDAHRFDAHVVNVVCLVENDDAVLRKFLRD